MRWKLGRRSQNIEDRRGMSGGGRTFPAGFRLPRGGGGIRVGRGAGLGGGIGLVAFVLIALFLGVDPGVLLQDGTTTQAPATRVQAPTSAEEEELAEMTSAVLADTEDTWRALFQEELGESYDEPTLVLFSDVVESACGQASSAVGPFYCPADRQVYIDLSFFDELSDRFGAPGDFAQGYVIAHEVGHHVQTLLGISDEVRAARQQLPEVEANRLSVMQELQADCFAGVWAHNAEEARDFLESGDVEEGLNAASAIGDDRLQRQTQGQVVPDAFTHGTSEQRVRWFKTGLEAGELRACDTFNAPSL